MPLDSGSSLVNVGTEEQARQDFQKTPYDRVLESLDNEERRISDLSQEAPVPGTLKSTLESAVGAANYLLRESMLHDPIDERVEKIHIALGKALLWEEHPGAKILSEEDQKLFVEKQIEQGMIWEAQDAIRRRIETLLGPPATTISPVEVVPPPQPVIGSSAEAEPFAGESIASILGKVLGS